MIYSLSFPLRIIKARTLQTISAKDENKKLSLGKEYVYGN
jgi:hypothetical protein